MRVSNILDTGRVVEGDRMAGMSFIVHTRFYNKSILNVSVAAVTNEFTNLASTSAAIDYVTVLQIRSLGGLAGFSA